MSNQPNTIHPARPFDQGDAFFTTEDLASGPLVFNLLADDRRPTSLYSLDADQVADLLEADAPLAAELSRLGASIWITADGLVGYAMDPAMAQSLAEGETIEDSFLYAARLGHGHGSLIWSTVRVTITGSNDAPVAGADFAQAGEDTLAFGSVAANDVDVDHGAVLRFAATGALPTGFALTADGGWTLDASDAAYQSLGASETVQVVLPYEVIDEYGVLSRSTLTVTVTGRNDAPEAQDDFMQGLEGFRSAGSVAWNDLDADHDARLRFEPTGALPAGFAMAPDGEWTFDASDPAYDSLPAGETIDFVITYRAIDEHGATSEATLTVAVTGSNDGPVAQADFAQVAEDGHAAGSVASNDIDPDHGAVLHYTAGGFFPSGPLPTGFVMAHDGSWTFDASDPSWQAFGEGETHQIPISYIVTDEHGAMSQAYLLIAVTGTNDAPVVLAARQGDFVVEDGPTLSGQIGFEDLDLADRHSASAVRLGTGPALGSLTVDGFENGWGSPRHVLNWHFTPGPGLQALEEGELALEQFAITISDGHGGTATQIVTVPIRGSGDAPVATPANAMVLEDTVLNGWLSLSATDPDHFSWLSFRADSVPAGFTLAPNGDWSFDARHAAYQPLNAGQTMAVVVPYTATDPTGRTGSSTLTITVFGVNDTIAVTPPPVFNGTGDPNDFDMLVGGVVNNAVTITASPAGGTITGGPAAQTITGADFSVDTIYGGGGNDAINGRGNADRLYGQAGADTITVGWGTAILYGGSGNDILRGQTPQAEATSGVWPITLYGGSGSDTLIGGGNADILVGGYGADTMTGAGNFDTFVFNSVLDTGDRITDFFNGIEKLDFRGIDANPAISGDQAFLWSHSGPAANSLWAVQQGPDTVIFADTDGNLSTAEFMLTLQNLFWLEPAGLPSGFML